MYTINYVITVKPYMLLMIYNLCYKHAYPESQGFRWYSDNAGCSLPLVGCD